MSEARRAEKYGSLRAIEPTATSHVGSLSYAVDAVAMTLLVLDLKLPPMSERMSAGQFSAQVFALWPKLVICVCSFVVLSKVWEIHRYLFHVLKSCDQAL